MHVTCVVGARPNFMKVAPILEAARAHVGLTTRLVHTGQHYDDRMSAAFFEELELPTPDSYLGVGSGSHAVQTARIMERFDADLELHPTDLVLVVGDVNSTLACALVAVKRGVAVAHVEAGLRSGDRSMPEEINRILTDQISDVLFTTERSASDNLAREGVDLLKVHFVGNVMIDTLLKHRQRAAASGVGRALGVDPRTYALVTLHRPSNVDDDDALRNTLSALRQIAGRLPVVLPLHPRTRRRLADAGALADMARWPGLRIVDPLGYLDFLSLMDGARLVFTDSGGIQEETTALGVPCLTFRATTERPITITDGTNQLVGLDPGRVAAAVDGVLGDRRPVHRCPELWDGHAAERIVSVLAAGSAAGQDRPAPPSARRAEVSATGTAGGPRRPFS
jgi:UDP-N-acetylglucosamine 2-epimerase (non-hydrolysing)